MAEPIKLNKSQTEKQDPTTVVTTIPEKDRTRTTYTELTPEQQADAQRQQQAVNARFGVNQEGTDVLPTFYERFGLQSPVDAQKQAAEEQALSQRKKQESALYNALALIGDMTSATVGGNVWQRQPRDVAKEEQTREDFWRQWGEAKRNQEAAARQKAIEDAAAARQKALADYVKMNGRQVVEEHVDEGQKSVTRTPGAKTTTGYREEQPRVGKAGGSSSSTSSSSGASGGSTTNLNVRQKNGENVTVKIENFSLPNQSAKNLGEFLVTRYSELIADGDDALKNELARNQVIKTDQDGNITSFDWPKLLASGIIPNDDIVHQEILKVAEKTLSAEDLYVLQNLLAAARAQSAVPVVKVDPEKESWIKQKWNALFGVKEEEPAAEPKKATFGVVPQKEEEYEM